jgi:hypothetical protein
MILTGLYVAILDKIHKLFLKLAIIIGAPKNSKIMAIEPMNRSGSSIRATKAQRSEQAE